MIFPLIAYELITPFINLVFALLIGVGFGYTLEQAGLGNAKKLIGQFLFKDLAVFKVMFSAIVTAMVGLYFLSTMGLLNIDLIHFPDTYLIPQMIAGLLLGAGFVIAGYCPGTSIVGIACGKIDAIYTFTGLLLGTLFFAVLFKKIESFYFSGQIVDDHLSQVTKFQYGSIVFIIIILASIAFYFSEKIDLKSIEANDE